MVPAKAPRRAGRRSARGSAPPNSEQRHQAIPACCQSIEGRRSDSGQRVRCSFADLRVVVRQGFQEGLDGILGADNAESFGGLQAPTGVPGGESFDQSVAGRRASRTAAAKVSEQGQQAADARRRFQD